jgi:GT2 family glycosyltransferase
VIILGVPTLNRYDLLPNLLRSAWGGTVRPDLCVVIDNGGKLRLPQANGDRTLVQRPGRNLGVGPSWNLLAREYLTGAEDRLLLCGDDVTLHPDTIEQLLVTMSEKDADMAYPSATDVAFSCFMVRAALFEKIGYFDERFYPAYFEDGDFLYRMKLAGIVAAPARGGYEHVGSATIKKLKGKELEDHHANFIELRNYYVEKWGGLPGAERFAEPFDGKPERHNVATF